MIQTYRFGGAFFYLFAYQAITKKMKKCAAKSAVEICIYQKNAVPLQPIFGQ
jgi:hypothetical protein